MTNKKTPKIHKNATLKHNLIDTFIEAYAYETGIHREKDFTKAAKIWQNCADAGSQYALDRLSRLFQKGVVSEEDLTGKKGKKEGSQKNQGKVLIIEDGEDTLKILEYIVKKAGFTPVLATDGLDGLEKTLFHQDLVAMLIDLQMPNMNGFEFIATLRKEEAFPDVPIVIVTAFTDKKLILKGQKFKIQGWITKPINKDLVISTLEKVTRRKEEGL